MLASAHGREMHGWQTKNHRPVKGCSSASAGRAKGLWLSFLLYSSSRYYLKMQECLSQNKSLVSSSMVLSAITFLSLIWPGALRTAPPTSLACKHLNLTLLSKVKINWKTPSIKFIWHRHKRSGSSPGALRHPKDKEDTGMFPDSSSFPDDPDVWPFFLTPRG